MSDHRDSQQVIDDLGALCFRICMLPVGFDEEKLALTVRSCIVRDVSIPATRSVSTATTRQSLSERMDQREKAMSKTAC